MDEFKLQTEPAERIVFSGEKLGEETVAAKIEITNPTKDTVVYKVKCTSNDMFRIPYPRDFIKEGETVTVPLRFNAGEGVPESGLHHFCVSYIMKKYETKSAKECWAEHKGEPEREKHILIDFEKKEDKLNAIYKGMLSAAIESSVVPSVQEENDEDTEDDNQEKD